MNIKLLRTAIFLMFIGSCNTHAATTTFNTSFDTYDNPLLEIISSDTGEVIDSGLISGGFTSYDTALGNGSFQFDATLDFFGAISLHDVLLTTNSDGSIRMQGLIDFDGLNSPDNNFIGDFIVRYDYDDMSDVTIFTYSPIAFAGSPFDGVLMTDGPFVGDLFDFQLTSSFLAYVDNPYPTYSPVPIPSAVWLFGSGLIGLIGLVRRKAHI